MNSASGILATEASRTISGDWPMVRGSPDANEGRDSSTPVIGSGFIEAPKPVAFMGASSADVQRALLFTPESGGPVSGDRSDARGHKFSAGRALEIGIQELAQLKARTPETRLHGGGRDVKRLGDFFGGKAFYVAELKHDSIPHRKARDRGREDLLQLLLGIALLRVRTPILEFAGDRSIFGFDEVVYGDFLRTAPTDLHEPFIDGDADKPRVKARVAAEIVQIVERLEKRVLHDLFCVFASGCESQGQAKHTGLITLDERFKGGGGAGTRLRDQPVVVTLEKVAG